MKPSKKLYLLQILLNIFVTSAVTWCLWASYKLWTTPITYTGIETVMIENGIDIEDRSITRTKTANFADISGAGVLPLLAPIFFSLIALLAVLVSRTTLLLSATCLFAIFWLISGLSIGTAYTPALLLLFCSLLLSLRCKRLNNQNNS